jgi:GTP cyclohydrolase I
MQVTKGNIIKANANKQVTDDEKSVMKDKIEKAFSDILEAMHYNLDDQQIKDTPKRIAKMYVQELFKGNFEKAPEFTVFENTKKIDEMVFVGPIDLKSTCSHHFVPFVGKAYVAYIPDKKVCGISKLARVVEWFMRRPQIQEELTKQISDYLIEKLETQNVAVYLEAKHLCMWIRGVEQTNSWMKTSCLQGSFRESAVRKEFFDMIK